MTARRLLIVLATLGALLSGAGCGDRDGAPLPAETDEPFYVQGVQLKKGGRHGEALTSFLKVIDRRGERGAAESHFEAGEIFLNHAKDPGEAYHHFRKYLELQPNSKQAELVAGRVETAKREFWKQVAGRPLDDQSVRLQVSEEVSKLRRENEELRAELAVLRGGGAIPVTRVPRMLTLPAEPSRTPPPPVPTAAIADSPLKPAPATATRNASAAAPLVIAPPAAVASRPAIVAAPSRTAPPTTAPRPAAASGRTHTLKAKETLYAVARQHNVKVEDLVALNGIRNPSAIPAGTVLKLPAPAGR